VDALGDVTKNEYDADGRVTRTIAYANVLANFSTLPANTDGKRHHFAADRVGADQATSHVYDKDGRGLHIDAMGMSPRGLRQRGQRHPDDRLRDADHAAGLADAIHVVPTDPKDETTRSVYDAANRASFLIDAAGYVTQRFYDGNGNVTKEMRYTKALQGRHAHVAPQDSSGCSGKRVSSSRPCERPAHPADLDAAGGCASG